MRIRMLTEAVVTNHTVTPFFTSGEEGGQCELLGPFALFVQAALGGLALLSLVFKRWREKPRREIKVWLFDVSKQVVGSVLVHMANIFMSMFSSGTLPSVGDGDDDSNPSAKFEDEYTPNPCSFYLLNLFIDTTIGILILVYTLRLLTSLCLLLPKSFAFAHGVTSGDYGQPPKARNWLKQSVIYFTGLMVMKFVVLTMFQLAPWLGEVGDWALRWTEGNRKVQIAFVMFIFPLIMNGIQYYIIDGFIKKQETSPHLGDDDDNDSGEARDDNNPQIQPSSAVATVGIDGERPSDEYDDDNVAEDQSLLKSSKPSKGVSTKVRNVQDYDNDDSPPQGSNSGGRITLVDKTKKQQKR